MSESDAELVKQARKGDRTASDRLFRRYWKQIGVFIYQKLGPRGDWEDLLQDIFAKAYRSLKQLRHPERFGPWLYTIAGSACMDVLRAQMRRPDGGSIDDVSESLLSAPADESKLNGETLEAVRTAIGDLPDNYRVVINLRFLEGMSAKDIADFLGEPAGTIRNRIFRANRMLEEKLKEYF
ncbi:MAG: sigma-70 family RNA polymerase sigma factor [Planctomycetota bacterium]|nr:MAG: sigma-70 family RNA polymerase sigma factor [Planctomycetota bacterium]